jgi:hypothetical protein
VPPGPLQLPDKAVKVAYNTLYDQLAKTLKAVGIRSSKVAAVIWGKEPGTEGADSSNRRRGELAVARKPLQEPT